MLALWLSGVHRYWCVWPILRLLNKEDPRQNLAGHARYTYCPVNFNRRHAWSTFT